MIDNPLDFLLNEDRDLGDLWRWATVTELGPLRIRLDNDEEPLEGSPTTLVDPQTLEIGSRVYVQLRGSKSASEQVGRRALVIGKGFPA